MNFQLTEADLVAITNQDHDYLNNKGADYYKHEDYATAIEYYRLAASMGNVYSMSNLGYCYMYARSVEKNMSLAIAYFKLAASHGNIDALYKLGNIYRKNEMDLELSNYYYQKAIQAIYEQCEEPENYPSLYFSIAKEHMPEGSLLTDLDTAYEFLNIAKAGYEKEIMNGARFYQKAYDQVIGLLNSDILKNISQENA